VRETAKRAFLAALIVVAVVISVLALWKLKILLALLFLAFTVAAAMRPGVEALKRRGIPRGAGILLHYAALFGLLAVLLWAVVPRAVTQVQEAVGESTTRPGSKARSSAG